MAFITLDMMTYHRNILIIGIKSSYSHGNIPSFKFDKVCVIHICLKVPYFRIYHWSFVFDGDDNINIRIIQCP